MALHMYVENECRLIPAAERKPEPCEIQTKDPVNTRNIRAHWLTRCSSTVLDLGLAALILSLFGNLGCPTHLIWPLVVFLYWGGTEWRWGRTPGKMVMGLRFQSRDGNPPTTAWLAIRTLLRCIVGPLAMLSWHRITLLDLLTGCRVLSARTTKAETLTGDGIR